jgi:hypothetical protein
MANQAKITALMNHATAEKMIVLNVATLAVATATILTGAVIPTARTVAVVMIVRVLTDAEIPTALFAKIKAAVVVMTQIVLTQTALPMEIITRSVISAMDMTDAASAITV